MVPAHRSLLLLICLALMVQLGTEGSRKRFQDKGRIRSLFDLLKRQRRSTVLAPLKVINRTGRVIYIVYMNRYRNPNIYTTLRPNEKKSFRSRLYTTWYAYEGSLSNYMLLNAKPSFFVLPRHARRLTEIFITSRDGRIPQFSKKSIPEKYIELMVLADYTMYKKYGADTERYILTIVNQGRRHFFDKSMVVKINLVVTRVKIIKKKENDFEIRSTNAVQNMRTACEFAARFNVPFYEDDRHFDFAIIFTRKKFGYSGFTPMYQMCKDALSCTLVHDRGLAISHVIPHEIAHSLGVDHDGQHNNCTSDGVRGSLMGKILYSRLDNYYWSRCSSEQFLQTIGYFHCLNDKPRVNHTRYMDKLPGVIMNRDEQCKFRYADHYVACTRPTHPYFDCKATYCAPNWNTDLCVQHSRPPLDGTKCDSGKGWCIKGTCYPYGRFTFNPIDGGWSSWQPWGPCSAGCGVGVSYRKRKCDNPRPKYDGKPCPGDGEEKKACKIKECPVIETVEDLRNNFCKSLRNQEWIWFTDSRSIKIVSATPGLNCSFETNCSWVESANDDFNWTKIRGKTPSYGTGPSDDHTFGNETGQYLFIEASTGEGDALRRKGFKARLISPLIHAPRVCFRFYYHMLGSHLGSLNIYKKDEDNETLLWKRTEDMGDIWLEGEVEIANSKAFKILIEGLRGSHYQGDIAIDDLTVVSGKCRNIANTTVNPCLISCASSNGTEFMTNVTIPDTYKCHNDDRLDICIAGKCEKLDCDLKFESNKTYDKCRSCGGDDTKCSLISMEKNITLNQTGETLLMNVPQKSTNVHIEIDTTAFNKIGIKAKDGGKHFPGDVPNNEQSSNYLVLLGQTYHILFQKATVTIKSDGPLKTEIFVVMAASKEQTVKLRYNFYKSES